MKEIKAIINPSKKSAVLDALREIEGLPAVICSDCHAHNVFSGNWDAQQKVKIELMVIDAQVETVVDAICRAATTGQTGDGRIHVIPIEESVLIRTGERVSDNS